MNYQARNKRLVELGYEDYDEYLKSFRWARLSETARERAEHRCQLCNNGGELHVHHRTYDRLGTDHEALDLIVLCSKCHEKFHGIRKPKRSIVVTTTYAANTQKTITRALKSDAAHERQNAVLRALRGGPLRAIQIAHAAGCSTGKAGAALNVLRTRKLVVKKGKLWQLTTAGRSIANNS